MIPYQLTEATEKSHFSGILSISSKTLGEGYLEPHDFTNTLYKWLVLIDPPENIIAFISYSVYGPLSIIADVAVHPGYQKKGIGTYLVSTVSGTITSLYAVESIRCQAWKHTHGIPLKKALETNGFMAGETHSLTSLNPRDTFVCPYCGKDCQCKAITYEKIIEKSY